VGEGNLGSEADFEASAVDEGLAGRELGGTWSRWPRRRPSGRPSNAVERANLSGKVVDRPGGSSEGETAEATHAAEGETLDDASNEIVEVIDGDAVVADRWALEDVLSKRSENVLHVAALQVSRSSSRAREVQAVFLRHRTEKVQSIRAIGG
jgi:hypothetical protein